MEVEGIPVYATVDLVAEQYDGEFYLTEFDNYLKSLLNQSMLDSETEVGITKLAISQGTRVLSRKQLGVILAITRRYCRQPCNNCGEIINWSEVVDAYQERGCCSHCNAFLEKHREA